MPSDRSTRSQTDFAFVTESEATADRSKPQRGPSAPADVKKTTLDTVSENLMEQVVETRNMEKAWKNVKANGGAPGPDGVTLDKFFRTFRDQS
jgi:hypothetical protein